MRLRTATDADLADLAAMAAPLQQRAERHIIYLGEESAGIEAELAESNWPAGSAVAIDDDGSVAGWLIADVDDEMGRVWWLGPFVTASAWEPLADRLLAEVRGQLADGVTEEEMAVDDRFERFGPWAERHGFAGVTGAWVLTLDRDLAAPADRDDVAFRPMTTDDHDAVGRLHDDLFPGAHTTGVRLAATHDAQHPRLVAVAGVDVLGYVAVERQADGSGYIDFVGVDPAHRRRGLGGDLVRAAVAALAEAGAAGVHLTVREDAAGARDLYASLGFTEQRLARAYRKGFGID